MSMEYAWDLFLHQDRRCALSDELLVFMPTYLRRKEQTASLDRINSSVGYIPSNIQWVHKDVNRMKNNLTPERFLQLCKAVGDHHAV